jgi:hypothetical protein
MRHVLHRRRCGVYGDQLDGPAVLVDVDGFRRRRGVLLVAVGQAGFGERDVLDWGGLAVVWLLILVVVRVQEQEQELMLARRSLHVRSVRNAVRCGSRLLEDPGHRNEQAQAPPSLDSCRRIHSEFEDEHPQV